MFVYVVFTLITKSFRSIVFLNVLRDLSEERRESMYFPVY